MFFKIRHTSIRNFHISRRWSQQIGKHVYYSSLSRDVFQQSTHQQIKQLRQLKKSSVRKQQGLFLVETTTLVREAIKNQSNCRIESIFIDDSLPADSDLLTELAADSRLKSLSFVCNGDVLRKAIDVKSTSGVVGVFHMPKDFCAHADHDNNNNQPRAQNELNGLGIYIFL
jgi:tRNA G18 (ribose-2'-O)-methylase SpoU